MSRNGLHHVTAISGPTRRNLDFYTRLGRSRHEASVQSFHMSPFTTCR